MSGLIGPARSSDLRVNKSLIFSLFPGIFPELAGERLLYLALEIIPLRGRNNFQSFGIPTDSLCAPECLLFPCQYRPISDGLTRPKSHKALG